MDRWDVLYLVGMALLGGALYLWLGPVAVLAYAGVVLMVVGLVGALRTRPRAGRERTR